MDDHVITVMAADLQISQYATETETQYSNRVLYSALACWAKAASLDRTCGNNNAASVSRRHILDRCQPVLNQMLLRHPTSRPWFYTTAQTDDPIIVIRSRLIRHGDLLNYGFNTNLALAKERIYPISKSQVTHIGIILDRETYYSGVSVIGNVVSPDYHEPIETQDTLYWYRDFVKNAWWKSADRLDDSVQYFNARKKAKNNYSCWESTLPEHCSGVVLARRNVNINAYEYFLIQTRESMKIHRIDPFLQEIGEHRRFMMALRLLENNRPPCEAFILDDHTYIRLWIHLPQTESCLFESYAWPHRNIVDVLEWDMPTQIWMCIRTSLEALGLEIMEVKHG